MNKIIMLNLVFSCILLCNISSIVQTNIREVVQPHVIDVIPVVENRYLYLGIFFNDSESRDFFVEAALPIFGNPDLRSNIICDEYLVYEVNGLTENQIGNLVRDVNKPYLRLVLCGAH